MLDRILPVEDDEISAFARKAFEKQGMKILTGATVKTLKKTATTSVTATIEGGGKTSRARPSTGSSSPSASSATSRTSASKAPA